MITSMYLCLFWQPEFVGSRPMNIVFLQRVFGLTRYRWKYCDQCQYSARLVSIATDRRISMVGHDERADELGQPNLIGWLAQ